MGDWKCEMCKRNNETWVLGHTAYAMGNEKNCIDPEKVVYTNRGSHVVKPGFFVEDPHQRGFLLISPMGDGWFELYFALVDAEHRRQGILRAMVSELVTRLPSRSTIWLECTEGVAPYWDSLNFLPTREKVEVNPFDECTHEFKRLV